MAIELDSKRSEGSGRPPARAPSPLSETEQKNAYERKNERQIARAIEIIRECAPELARDKWGDCLSIAIGTKNNKEIRRKLTDKTGNTLARATVKSLYAQKYQEELTDPNLRAAIGHITRELFNATEEIADEIEDESAPIGSIIRQVEEGANWIAPAIDAGARYARVPEGERRGMWRLQGSKTARLCSAPVIVRRGRRPSAGSKQARLSSTVLEFSCSPGSSPLVIEVTDDQYTSNELANKLLGYASYPEAELQRRQFAEMVKELGRTEGATYQDELETYGMHRLLDGRYIFALVNGCEARGGFLEGEAAPALAPSLPVPQNGYSGKQLAPFSPPEDLASDFWYQFLHNYASHPQIEALNCALFGLGALVQVPEELLPPGISAENGYLRLSPDLIGPSRVGKSRTLNAHLSRFGTGFRWDTPPLLKAPEAGKSDTAYAQNMMRAAMKNMMYANYDHKAAPDSPDFETDRKNRRGDINNYTDGPKGGARGKRGGGTEDRGAPSGFSIRTCNTDLAPYEIADGGDKNELRACSFVWPEGVAGDYELSIAIDKRVIREQVYAIEQGFRRWLMEKAESCPEEFKNQLIDWQEIAHDMAGAAMDYPDAWVSDYHRNHVELMLLGCLIYMGYLEECLPGYHLYKWLETRMDTLLSDRAARSLYVGSLITRQKEARKPEHIILDAIKWAFSWKFGGYVRSQRGELLTDDDIQGEPFRLDQVGYVSRFDAANKEVFQPGRETLCYWVNKGTNLAFSPEVLARAVASYCRQELKIEPPGSLTPALKVLFERGMLVPRLDKKTGKVKEYKAQVKVSGRNDDFIVIPVAALFAAQGEQGEEINPEDEPETGEGERPANVRDFPASLPETPAPASLPYEPLTDVSDDAFEEIPL